MCSARLRSYCLSDLADLVILSRLLAPYKGVEVAEHLVGRRGQLFRSSDCLVSIHLATIGIVADFLVDTAVFVEHLRGPTELEPKAHRVHYSVVTRAELFAGNTASEIVTVLLAPFREIEVDREIAERAGRLRRESGIRLPEALIAATAVVRKLSLFTRSRSDFGGVRGLRIRDIG